MSSFWTHTRPVEPEFYTSFSNTLKPMLLKHQFRKICATKQQLNATNAATEQHDQVQSPVVNVFVPCRTILTAVT